MLIWLSHVNYNFTGRVSRDRCIVNSTLPDFVITKSFSSILFLKKELLVKKVNRNRTFNLLFIAL